MNKLAVCAGSLALALGAGIGLVSAQDKVDQNTTQELKKADPVPPATGKTLPDQAGTQEPSGKVPGTNPNPDALANGSLAVEGAAADTETTPSKYSARNAASDRLPTVAFRLKHLTDDQRRQIYEQLTDQRGTLALSPGHEDRFARLGAQLPASVVLRDLTLVPEAMAAKVPELRGAAFMKSGTSVLIVDPRNSQVIGILAPQ